MKIAMIHERVGRFGGAEWNVWLVANELSKRGHEIHIFASKWNEEIAGVKYHKVPVFCPISFLRPLLFALSCKRLVLKENFDVIHSSCRTMYQDSYRTEDGCHREWLKILAGERGFWGRILIGLSLKNYLILWQEKRLFEDAGLKKVIANSQMVKNSILKHYNVSESKFVVINVGVRAIEERIDPCKKTKIREKLGLGANDYVILFSGSNYERKGLRFLISAVKGVEKVRVIVIGKGDERRYKRLAEKEGVLDKFHFFGFVSNSRDFFRASDIFVLPTLYDPFSNVVLDAMGYGLPVITTPANGAAEAIDEGIDGFVAKPENIREKILALRDESLRKMMGEAALKKARAYSLEKMTDKTTKVYSDIAANGSKMF